MLSEVWLRRVWGSHWRVLRKVGTGARRKFVRGLGGLEGYWSAEERGVGKSWKRDSKAMSLLARRQVSIAGDENKMLELPELTLPPTPQKHLKRSFQSIGMKVIQQQETDQNLGRKPSNKVPIAPVLVPRPRHFLQPRCRWMPTTNLGQRAGHTKGRTGIGAEFWRSKHLINLCGAQQTTGLQTPKIAVIHKLCIAAAQGGGLTPLSGYPEPIPAPRLSAILG